MYHRLLFVIMFVFLPGATDAGNSRFFATESCSRVLGPDFGVHVEYDRSVTQDKKKNVNVALQLRGKVFECLLVIRGMPSATKRRFLSVFWREFHVVDPKVKKMGYTPEDCKRAYVTLYNGMDRTAKENYTLCGPDVRKMSYEFEGEYAALYIYADYRNPKFVPTAAPPKRGKPDPQPPDDFPYPQLYFKIDFTTYDFECNDSVEGSHMKCNESKRCLDDSLRCDFWFSRNCASDLYPKDVSDSSKKPPGNCYKRTTPEPTTTTPAPPPPPPDFTPLYATLGSLAGLITLVWCCCRPGYLPWRLSRLRNCPCCNSCGNCWSKICPTCGPGSGGPRGGPAWRSGKDELLADDSPVNSNPGSQAPPFFGNNAWKKPNSVSPSDDYPDGKAPISNTKHPYAPSETASNPDTDSTTLSNGWLNFLSGDGGHLREHR